VHFNALYQSSCDNGPQRESAFALALKVPSSHSLLGASAYGYQLAAHPFELSAIAAKAAICLLHATSSLGH